MTTQRIFDNAQQLASLIDHTLLKPDAMEADIIVTCQQALEASFASVCVNPVWVPTVARQLSASKVRVCSVVGFPLGASQTVIKLQETQLATQQGASEIDMVINIGELRSGNSKLVEDEIRQLAKAAHSSGAILKVIIETCLLNNDQKVLACQLAKSAGADFVKTSTGFSTAGATEADVSLMRSTVGPTLGVKASGGVRSLETVKRMVIAGATRIGTSSGVQILAEFRSGSVAGNSGVSNSY